MKKVFKNIIEEIEKAKIGRGIHSDFHNGRKQGLQQAIEIVNQNADHPEIAFDLGGRYEQKIFDLKQTQGSETAFSKEVFDHIKNRLPNRFPIIVPGAGKSHWVEELFKRGKEVLDAKEQLEKTSEKYTPEYIDHLNELGLAGAKAGKTTADSFRNFTIVVGNYREKHHQEVNDLKIYFMAKYSFYQSFKKCDVTTFIQAIISTTHLIYKNNTRFIDLSDNERNLILARVALDYNFIVQDLQERIENLEEVNAELRFDEAKLLERCQDLEEKLYHEETGPKEADVLKQEIKSLQSKIEQLEIFSRDRANVIQNLRTQISVRANMNDAYHEKIKNLNKRFSLMEKQLKLRGEIKKIDWIMMFIFFAAGCTATYLFNLLFLK